MQVPHRKIKRPVEPESASGQSGRFKAPSPTQQDSLTILLMKRLFSRDGEEAAVACFALARRAADPLMREEVIPALISSLSDRQPLVRARSAEAIILAAALGVGLSEKEHKALLRAFSDPNVLVLKAARDGIVSQWERRQLMEFVSSSIPFLVDKELRVASGASMLTRLFADFLSTIRNSERYAHVLTGPLANGSPATKAAIAIACKSTLDAMNRRLEGFPRSVLGRDLPPLSSPQEAAPVIEYISRTTDFFAILKPVLEETAKSEERFARDAANGAIASIERNRELYAVIISKLPHAE